MRNLHPTARRSAVPKIGEGDAQTADTCSQFLIVGHGQLSPEVSIKLSQTVASWEMPNVQMQILSHLKPGHACLLEAIDYVFFLATCDQQHCRPQIVPVCPEQPQIALPDLGQDKSADHQKAKVQQSQPSRPVRQHPIRQHPVKSSYKKPLAQKTALNDVTHPFTPGQLLHRAQNLHGWHPQAWSLHIPAVLDGGGAPNPRIAQALDAIAVFLRCYAAPK